MKQCIVSRFLLLLLAMTVIDARFYSIVAPGTIKSNRKYAVSVTLHSDAEPTLVRISIMGSSYNNTEEISMAGGETRRVVFEPPKLRDATYQLLAEGVKGMRFKNITQITTDMDSAPKIYLQTDKAIYKPSDVVRFRVVMLDEHTRPLNIDEPIRVEVFDAKTNRIKQFKDIQLVKGVYTDKFQLSELPSLGTWKLLVTISGKYAHSKQFFFTVNKYVLPKFSVYVECPTNLLPQDDSFKVVIYGKYTFDKFVQGNATVYLVNSFVTHNVAQKTITVDRMTGVELPLKNRDLLQNVDWLLLQVELQEKHTGKTQSNSKIINVRHQQYDVRISDDLEFRDGKPFRLKVRVRHWTGAPVLDSITPVHLEYGGQILQSHMDNQGVAVFEFAFEPTSSFMVRYKDSKASLSNILAGNSAINKDNVLQLSLRGQRPRLGSDIEVELSSEQVIPYFVYTLTSHASIIQTQYVKVPPNQKYYILKIKPSIEMVPRSFLFVHYIENDNLIYEEITIDLPEEFENQITVTAPKEVPPGTEVTIKVHAQPESYVCLLAVDLSVYILNSGYDIKRDSIFQDLYSDRSYTPTISTKYPGLESGLVTLTNAYFPLQQTFNQNGVTGSGSGSLGPSVRNKFPETWIFENLNITKEDTELNLTIPDTITTWRITAFTVHESLGFGIVDGPTDVLTSKPFFVNLNLPYAIKKSEEVLIPITVFNYHNESVTAEITMLNEKQEFRFVDLADKTTEGKRAKRGLKKITKTVEVEPDNVESVSFALEAMQVGDIDLHVTAKSKLSEDAVLQKLKVEPVGVAAEVNAAMLVSIPLNSMVNYTLTAHIPQDIVPSSEALTLSVGGDNLAPALENLNGLVKRPTGCGEQNMVNLAPNILILQYLKAAGKLKQQVKLANEARKFVEIGCQQQLSFRHTNGGFSAFGERDGRSEASTWLTAYVTRFFMKAAKITAIEDKVITDGLQFLANNQRPSGDFAFTGYLFYPAQQNRFGFTAFVLMTFLEQNKYANKFQPVIEKGFEFLNGNLDKIKDVYALSIVAVALKMANHGNFNKVIDKLKGLAKEGEEQRWWSANDQNSEKDVEITSYVLLALLEAEASDVLPILKWLTSQRNGQGGFKSTHDTVVGLQALVKYSEKANDPNDLNMVLDFVAKDEKGLDLKSGKIMLDAANTLELQMEILPRSTRSIQFNASGSGQSLLQLSSSYYVATEEPREHFRIQPKSNLKSENLLELEICFTYQPSAVASKEIKHPIAYSNMVIMEVNLPTGFISDAEFSYELQENELVQRIQSKNSETTIVFYLDNLQANKTSCLNLEADKTHDAMRLKPAAIVMFDYYNKSRSNTAYYEI